MRFHWMLAGALLTPAHASELSDKAALYWNPPPGVWDVELSAYFDVDLAADGSVTTIHVTNYSPQTQLGKAAVRAASLAIEMCAPYAGVGRVHFTMRWPLPGPLDPFSPN